MLRSLCLVLVPFAIGGYLIAMGIEEKTLASRSKGEPEEISLQRLLARGRDGNPHLILKDFALCENFVLNKRLGSVEGGWMPIVPLDPSAPEGLQQLKQPPAAIIKSDASSEEDLIKRCSQSRLRGLVRLKSMEPSEAIVLKQAYPRIDTDKLIVFHEGKEPAGTLKWLSMFAGGGVGCLVGLVVVGRGITKLVRGKAPSAPGV